MVSFRASDGKKRKKRSFDSHEEQRLNALKQIEEVLSAAIQLDGHKCLLRVICEAAHTPSHSDGLIGDAINALLLPRHVLDIIPEYGQSEYVRAQRIGQKTGDCSAFHHECPKSIFQVLPQFNRKDAFCN